MEGPRLPDRLVDRIAAMLLGTVCLLVATYFAWLALDMTLPLLQRRTFSAAGTRRIAAGWLLVFAIGSGWLAATLASYGYVFYSPSGSVYSRALRVLGAVLAAGAAVQIVFTVRVAMRDLPVPIWASAAPIGPLAAAAAGASVLSGRLRRVSGRRRASAGQTVGGA